MEMLLSQEYSLWRCLYLRDIVVEVLVSQGHTCGLWRCLYLMDVVCGGACSSGTYM